MASKVGTLLGRDAFAVGYARLRCAIFQAVLQTAAAFRGVRTHEPRKRIGTTTERSEIAEHSILNNEANERG